MFNQSDLSNLLKVVTASGEFPKLQKKLELILEITKESEESRKRLQDLQEELNKIDK